MRPRLTAIAFLLLPAAAMAQNRPPAPPSVRFDHLALVVADLDTSVSFYKRLFGLSELVPAVKGPRWLDLGNGEALHLFPGRSAPVPADRRVHLALAVADFDALVARLEREGIAFNDFEGKPATVQRVRDDGVRQIFLRDPDGYWIEVNDANAKHG